MVGSAGVPDLEPCRFRLSWEVIVLAGFGGVSVYEETGNIIAGKNQVVNNWFAQDVPRPGKRMPNPVTDHARDSPQCRLHFRGFPSKMLCQRLGVGRRGNILGRSAHLALFDSEEPGHPGVVDHGIKIAHQSLVERLDLG